MLLKDLYAFTLDLGHKMPLAHIKKCLDSIHVSLVNVYTVYIKLEHSKCPSFYKVLINSSDQRYIILYCKTYVTYVTIQVRDAYCVQFCSILQYTWMLINQYLLQWHYYPYYTEFLLIQSFAKVLDYAIISSDTFD